MRAPTDKKSPIPLIFFILGVITWIIGLGFNLLVLVGVGIACFIICLIPILAKGTKP